VEVLAERPGVAWVVDEVAALVAQHKPDAVVLDSASQARSLMAPLATAGVTVTTTDLKAMVEACGAATAATGGLPSPEQQSEIDHLGAEIEKHGKLDLVLILRAVIAMSTARYW
jgi:hypothetical protein